MTQQEKETHKEAGKYRRMTDQQLVDMVNDLKRQAEKAIAERHALAALAEEEKHRAEIAERAAQAAAQNMAEKVKEASEKASAAKEAAGKVFAGAADKGRYRKRDRKWNGFQAPPDPERNAGLHFCGRLRPWRGMTTM